MSQQHQQGTHASEIAELVSASAEETVEAADNFATIPLREPSEIQFTVDDSRHANHSSICKDSWPTFKNSRNRTQEGARATSRD